MNHSNKNGSSGPLRKKKIWLDLWLLVRGRRWRLALGLLLMILSRLAVLVAPAALKFVIDDVLGKQHTQLLLPLVGIMLLALIMQAASDALLTQVLATETQELMAALRRKAQARVVRLALAHFDKSASGELVSRIMSDAEGLRNLMGLGVMQFLGSALTGLFAFLILLKINIAMTILSMATLILLAVTLSMVSAKLRGIFRERSRLYASLTGRLTESIGGIRVVKGYGAEKQEEQVFSTGIQRLLQQTSKAITATASTTLLSTLLMGSVFPLITWMGARHIIGGSMTLGSFVTFTMFLGLLIAPMVQYVGITAPFNEAVAGFERIQEILSEPLEAEPGRRCTSLGALRGEVIFDRVSFGYRPEKTVLHEIDFSARPNTVTALVGPSGAGKSTIVNLLAAFYNPSSGSVWIDGVDLSTVRLDTYRSQLGLVLQDNFLFDGTIRENVSFARPGSTERAILEACRLARVDEFVESFPDRYDTVVGERGIRLSGGQRQRLSIARAILAEPRILLLDEATSSLDSESEALIQEGLSYLMGRCTTFVIAHRLSTIRHADQIIVLEGGRIVEAGSHESLYASSGRYFDLYTKQHGHGISLLAASGQIV